MSLQNTGGMLEKNSNFIRKQFMASLSQNYLNVLPGNPAILVASNLCDYFELGHKASGHWLEGNIIKSSNDFVFNGRMYLPGGNNAGIIIDNFPKASLPKGWLKRPNMNSEGYELVDSNGTILFAYEVLPNKICHVTVNVYDADGTMVAESLPNEFIIHKGPAMIGRNGISIGRSNNFTTPLETAK